MFKFKSFFKNHNTDFLVEGDLGETPESSVLIDSDDLDFLYQVDYKNWTSALATRYEVLLDALKQRDNTRRAIQAKFLYEFIKAYPNKEDRTNISLDSFVEFVKEFAQQYDDYGRKTGSENEKIKFKYWEKDFRDEYSQDFDIAKRKNSKTFIANIAHMIFNYIVPFAIENDRYQIKSKSDTEKSKSSPSMPWIRFYINRLIQKLETKKGEEVTLTDADKVYRNLSKVLMSDKPIEMEKIGKYGFDLNRARTQQFQVGDKSTALGKTRGLPFPNTRGSSGISNVLRELLRLNYQRHMGPLPSDENFSKYKDVLDDKGSPALVYKQAKAKAKAIEDNTQYEALKTSIYNKIVNFIARNRSETSWSVLKQKGLYDIVDSSFGDEIESGEWAASSNEMVNYILASRDNADAEESENSAINYVSDYRNIATNTKIFNRFAEYFAEKQVKFMLSSEADLIKSPRILDGDTVEERRESYKRLDDDFKRELERKLSAEELDKFKDTGRISLNINKDRLVPAGFQISPLIMPFLKIKNSDGEEISVPLVRPGRYLGGFSGVKTSKKSNKIDDLEDEDEDENFEDEADEKIDAEDENLSSITATPSTSDRTGVYIVKDKDGKEKEVKIIDAHSTERYTTKKGAKGAYFKVTTKGSSSGNLGKKYNFNRWKKSDKDIFAKTWAHPDFAGHALDSSVVRYKYQQIFGKDLMDIYNDIDPFDFYKKTDDSNDNYPLILRGYRLGREDEKPRPQTTTELDKPRDSSSVSSTSTSSLGNKILPDNQSPEIIGFPIVIKAISDCLALKVPVCNNEGNTGHRAYFLESANNIQELHDYMVKKAISKGVWKSFIYGGSAKHAFCAIMGKYLQSSAFGQIKRKSRSNLVGSASYDYFRKNLSNYENFITSKSSNKTQRSRTLDQILKIFRNSKPLDDDNDEDIASWFFPGYKELENKDKGQYISDPENFKPEFLDWPGGVPPTEIKNLVKELIETIGSRTISEEDKKIIIDKLNQEKEYLVGTGGVNDGILGLNSILFSKKLLDAAPEDSGMTIKQQVEAFHNFINKIYSKDIEIISGLKVSTKTKSVEDSIIDEENDNYIKSFKSDLLSLLPTIKIIIKESHEVNAIQYNGEIKKSIETLLDSISQESSMSGDNRFIGIISSIYYILDLNDKSLLSSFYQYINKIMPDTKQPSVTTNMERDYIRDNPNSNTRHFLTKLLSISENMVLLSHNFNEVTDKISLQLKSDEEYKKSISQFIQQNFVRGDKFLNFFRSCIFKNDSERREFYASKGDRLPDYKDFKSVAEQIKFKLLGLLKNEKPILRRVDAARFFSEPNFSNIGKMKTVDLWHAIKSKGDPIERSNMAKKVKEYYVSRKGEDGASTDWDKLNSYFKNFINSNIINPDEGLK